MDHATFERTFARVVPDAYRLVEFAEFRPCIKVKEMLAAAERPDKIRRRIPDTTKLMELRGDGDPPA
jgi:hypothetical protein